MLMECVSTQAICEWICYNGNHGNLLWSGMRTATSDTGCQYDHIDGEATVEDDGILHSFAT